jgi:type II secretory pathway pseudopilin PulG
MTPFSILRGSPQAARRLRADTGITLTEVVVSMSVMSVIMAIFTTGIIQMYRSVNKTESMLAAQSQVNTVFLRLDKEIRYASAISAPGPGPQGPDWYVEYLLATDSGVPDCTELRLHVGTGQLQRRAWAQGAVPSPTGWAPLVSHVVSTQPFTRPGSADAATFQQLSLALAVRSGSGRTATVRETMVTFTARNALVGTAGDAVCTEGRSVP